MNSLVEGWRLVTEGREAVLVDPRGVEVLRHWYVPFVRRCARRLGSRKGLNTELVRGICKSEAYFRVEFSAAYRDDFDRAAQTAE